jgi:hypothetical protein
MNIRRFPHVPNHRLRRDNFHVNVFIGIQMLVSRMAQVFGQEEVNPVGHDRRIGAHFPQLQQTPRRVGGFFRQLPGCRRFRLFPFLAYAAGEF